MRLSTLRRAGLPLAIALLLAASASAQSYTAALAGSNERPTPNASPATGYTDAVLSGTTLVVTGAFSGLTGDYAASHLHVGGPEDAGPVIIPLNPTVADDKRGGTFEASNNTFTLTAEQVSALQSNGLYSNIHSSTFGGGEIRGQLGPGQSIIAARAEALQSTVTIEGIVTRSLGRNTWIQDDTAGIVAFGPDASSSAPASPLFTAVESGAIRAGDRVRITGTLVEFQSGTTAMPMPGQGLLEVSSVADGDFTVVSRDNVLPALQTITLAQFVAGDPDTDAYESELITINNLTIDATRMTTFAASTNYTVSQTVDGVTTTATLRTGSPGDSEVIDQTIPTGPFTFRGPAGQFRGTNQLQPVLAADIVAGAVAAEGAPTGELSLAVANPVRGAAQVRFETLSGDARLAVYDVLGRRVATLADGAAAGAQTATLPGLPSGVYVLRLTAGQDVLTRTVTVVR